MSNVMVDFVSIINASKKGMVWSLLLAVLVVMIFFLVFLIYTGKLANIGTGLTDTFSKILPG